MFPREKMWQILYSHNYSLLQPNNENLGTVFRNPQTLTFPSLLLFLAEMEMTGSNNGDVN